MSAATLRWARTPADMDRIADIDRMCFAKHLSHRRVRCLSRLHNVFCRVIEVDEQIVAYAFLRLDKGLCELLRIATAEAYRMEGHASRLLATITAEPYWERVAVAVPDECEGLLRLFDRHGFAAHGTVDLGDGNATVCEFVKSHKTEAKP